MQKLNYFLVGVLTYLSLIKGLPLTDESEDFFLIEPDEISGRRLETWDGIGNPEEQGRYFEGDLIISPTARNGVTSPSQMWQNKKIPYQINGSFSTKEMNILSDAIDNIQKNSCLKFVPHGGETDYIVIENKNTGCWSSVGRTGGRQVVNLQPQCLNQRGTVEHEFMHALGFLHEQNRKDRDSYVKVMTQNIEADKMINFEKVSEDQNFNVGYDYGSVLHYSSKAFSKNGQPTILTKGGADTNKQMGQRVAMSAKDIKKLNAMYCK